jgi:streptomycin 6-kinase
LESAVDIAKTLHSLMVLWQLLPDGEPFQTPCGSLLAPVRHLGTAAMLKIAGGPEERDGAALMTWWVGDGAAPVLAQDGEAILLERATGGTLANLTRRDRDDEATAILCSVAAKLHAPRSAPPPATIKPLERWFRDLWPAAERHGGILKQAAMTARGLLAAPMDLAILHGDLHHENVLDFGPKGWLAIDPKGLLGERGYDFANLFCNPWPEADDAPRLDRRLALVAATAELDPARLRRWVIAHAGLSAAWTLESNMPTDGPWRALRIAEMAAAGL